MRFTQPNRLESQYGGTAIVERPNLQKDLTRALDEANAPIRSSGPSLMRIGSLIVQQLIRGDRDNSDTVPASGDGNK